MTPDAGTDPTRGERLSDWLQAHHAQANPTEVRLLEQEIDALKAVNRAGQFSLDTAEARIAELERMRDFAASETLDVLEYVSQMPTIAVDLLDAVEEILKAHGRWTDPIREPGSSETQPRAEPRSELRRQLHVNNVCPICSTLRTRFPIPSPPSETSTP